MIDSEEAAIAAVNFARTADKRILVVSGGHSYIGNGLQDDTVFLDLSGMAIIRINAATNEENSDRVNEGTIMQARLPKAIGCLPITQTVRPRLTPRGNTRGSRFLPRRRT